MVVKFGVSEEEWNGGSRMWPFICPHLRDDYENVVTGDMVKERR